MAHIYFNWLYLRPIKLYVTDGFRKLERFRLLYVCKFFLSPLPICSSRGVVNIITALWSLRPLVTCDNVHKLI